MNISQLKEEIKSIVEGRGVKTIQKDYSQVLSDIEKALDFYKKNKDTDKKDAFVKVLKKLGEKKKQLAKELDDKVSGMYRNAEYQGESVNEAKDMAFVDYLKVLDDKFLDGMKAVRGDNGSDAQIKPTRGDILQNFTLFRNYLSALTKKYKGDKTKLRFLTERANRLNEIIKPVNEASSEPQIITQLRDVVKNGYKTLKDPKTGKNMKVDSYSASAITQVYDAINNPSTKDKFVKSGLLGMQSVSFKAIRK